MSITQADILQAIHEAQVRRANTRPPNTYTRRELEAQLGVSKYVALRYVEQMIGLDLAVATKIAVVQGGGVIREVPAYTLTFPIPKTEHMSD